MLWHMGCIKLDNLIEMHDKPQTFLSVVDKMAVHSLVLFGVAIRVRSFEFTTVEYNVVISFKQVWSQA